MLDLLLHWRRRVHVGRASSASGRIWIHGGGRIRIGDRVRLDARRAPIELHAARGAEIVIGDDVIIEGGTSIEAQASVTVGAGCRVAAFCKIIDNQFHPLTGDRRRQTAPIPVELGAGAELGVRAIVLAGARVPPAAVIPPGAVVRGPPRAARRALPARKDG